MKPLLKAMIRAGDSNEVRSFVYLYREDTLVWRFGGEYGDAVEALPTPKTVGEAKRQLLEVYPINSVWETIVKWKL